MTEKIKIVCIIPTLPGDLHKGVLEAIMRQTVKVETIVLFLKQSAKPTILERISENLNEGLKNIRLEAYDYILRVDSDSIIPPNFIEENLKDQPDLCGKSGYGMLIKAGPFLKLMGGRVHQELDDSYLSAKFQMEGAKVQDWKVKPNHLRKDGSLHGIPYYLNRGRQMYKLGYEPIHVLFSPLWNIGNLFSIPSYFWAAFWRKKRYDVAQYVFRKQVGRLKRF